MSCISVSTFLHRVYTYIGLFRVYVWEDGGCERVYAHAHGRVCLYTCTSISVFLLNQRSDICHSS